MVGKTDHRNHQAARRVDRKTEMHVFELHHLFTEPVGIEIGEFNNRLSNRVENEIVDGDARFILGCFKLFSSVQNCTRIGLSVHGELRGGLHRVEHPVSNQFANAFDLNFF